ncbi:YdcF family protein [Brucella anthropi]|uniref:YdcF family protein n=1 Tax=Brucella/Ochrobactrum group TaxID=2826938 RepID=UPI00124CA301|nr:MULTISPECIES: YdcF family protein [Brucella/Ochrobactrum group]KAB2763667.1 YdcF family protein [Brucella anthropi]KAB2780341.1 YdcF family protein [Brucella anthropi]MCQ9144399.1 YdcF family protein [Ochrobactrum sp. BTU2]UGQ21268.1 YdcF family protein [Brucella anthropi]
MMLNLIVVFVVAGLLLHFFNWRKTGIVLIGLAAIFYGAIASAILPDTLMSRLQSAYSSQLQTQLEDNTAFIVFGMGTQTVDGDGQKVVEPLAFSYGPILAAVAMNRQCVEKGFRCKFIASGADVAGTGVSEAASIATQLEKAGVDPASVLLDEKSRNSWQNSRNVAAILREIRPAKVVLLQAAPMMKRDLLYLAHFGVKPEPVAAGYLTGSHTNMSSPGLSFLMTDLALHEEIGVWRYTLYNFMGWNEPKQPPLQLGQATSSLPTQTSPAAGPVSAQ